MEATIDEEIPHRHAAQRPNLSRPNSLLGPEKEPMKFQINILGAPPEVENLIEHIKDVTSKFLYHWKTFPISKYYSHSLNTLEDSIIFIQTCHNQSLLQPRHRPSTSARDQSTLQMSERTGSLSTTCEIYSFYRRSTNSTRSQLTVMAISDVLQIHNSGRLGNEGK